MGTLVLKPQPLVSPTDETRPDDRTDAAGPDEIAAAPAEAPPLAEAAGARVALRFDLDL
jgi:hypothetical protein